MRLIQKTLSLIGLMSLVGLLIYAVQDAPTDENFEKKIINDYNLFWLNMVFQRILNI